NLSPGASVYLSVRVQRRGVSGDIEVAFPQLPPGVTASPTVIRAGETQGFIVLTAGADAPPGSFAATRALGRTVVNGQAITREAAPYEIYKINNSSMLTARSTMAVSVGPELGWRASVETSGGPLAPGGAPVKV